MSMQKRKREKMKNETTVKKRKTLSEQLAELTDPTPKDFDPEEPMWDSDLHYENYEEQDFSKSTKLNSVPTRRPMVSRAITMGPEYRGKKSSRKELLGGNSDEETENEEKEQAENIMKKFSVKFSDEESLAESTDSDDVFDDYRKKESDTLKQVNELEEYLEDYTEKEFTDSTISNARASADKKKSLHTLNQKSLWDSFVDLRIKSQNLVTMSYRFPYPEDRELFCEYSENGKKEKIKDLYETVSSDLQGIITNLSKIQSNLLKQNPLMASLISNVSKSDFSEWDNIYETQKRIEEYSGPILEKWQTKALHASGMNFTKFTALNQSILTQVNSIMSGSTLETFVKRTQIVDPPEEPKKNLRETSVKIKRVIGSADNEQSDGRTYDPNIYNDEEFYTSLLRERIQSGLANIEDTNDPILMSQRYLSLKRLKKRKNRAVNTRATKGRKLRYQPHQQLVSYMAPAEFRYPKQDTLMAKELFHSLFGTKKEN